MRRLQTNRRRSCETLEGDAMSAQPIVLDDEKIVLPDGKACCPQCGAEAYGLGDVYEVFGFRRMGDHTLRAQSWCRACRAKGRKHAHG